MRGKFKGIAQSWRISSPPERAQPEGRCEIALDGKL